MSIASSSSDNLAIGVDVGGTKVAAALVDQQGTILFQTRNPMVCDRGPENGLLAVISAIEAVMAKSKGSLGKAIQGIGICAPGPLDPVSGVVLNPPNLPCWRDFPLAGEVSRRYGAPVAIDNDANAAGLGEAIWGAGRGYNNVFYFTIGTGIGTAIVLDGRIFHGRTGGAGEGGHLSIDYKGPLCACGKRGCIEAFASGPSMARRAREKMDAGRSSMLLDLAGGKAEHITGKIIGEAYSAGDPLAIEILSETAELLSFWLGNIVDLLDPEVMIMGGGAAAMLMPFLDEMKKRLTDCCLNSRSGEIPLVPARYGEDAGVAGGAAICFAAARRRSC
ncbi:MAG TPA: ROK family protein [Candidatus Aquilonibacter sp.]|nr:ROK family protein [Candidatus Aquilonibacter sp.]